MIQLNLLAVPTSLNDSRKSQKESPLRAKNNRAKTNLREKMTPLTNSLREYESEGLTPTRVVKTNMEAFISYEFFNQPCDVRVPNIRKGTFLLRINPLLYTKLIAVEEYLTFRRPRLA